MREFKTVLCPTDFSESSYKALDYALKFARDAGGTLLLVHFVHVASEPRGVRGEPEKPAQLRQHALDHLREARTARLTSYEKTEILVEFGDPIVHVPELARRRDADLIVISTHGRTGLKHRLMGSVAENIIRHAPCPVFVVRAEAS